MMGGEGGETLKKKTVGAGEEEEKRVHSWGRSLCGTRAVVNIGRGGGRTAGALL